MRKSAKSSKTRPKRRTRNSRFSEIEKNERWQSELRRRQRQKSKRDKKVKDDEADESKDKNDANAAIQAQSEKLKSIQSNKPAKLNLQELQQSIDKIKKNITTGKNGCHFKLENGTMCNKHLQNRGNKIACEEHSKLKYRKELQTYIESHLEAGIHQESLEITQNMERKRLENDINGFSQNGDENGLVGGLINQVGMKNAHKKENDGLLMKLALQYMPNTQFIQRLLSMKRILDDKDIPHEVHNFLGSGASENIQKLQSLTKNRLKRNQTESDTQIKKLEQARKSIQKSIDHFSKQIKRIEKRSQKEQNEAIKSKQRQELYQYRRNLEQQKAQIVQINNTIIRIEQEKIDMITDSPPLTNMDYKVIKNYALTAFNDPALKDPEFQKALKEKGTMVTDASDGLLHKAEWMAEKIDQFADLEFGKMLDFQDQFNKLSMGTTFINYFYDHGIEFSSALRETNRCQFVIPEEAEVTKESPFRRYSRRTPFYKNLNAKASDTHSDTESYLERSQVYRRKRYVDNYKEEKEMFQCYDIVRLASDIKMYLTASGHLEIFQNIINGKQELTSSLAYSLSRHIPMSLLNHNHSANVKILLTESQIAQKMKKKEPLSQNDIRLVEKDRIQIHKSKTISDSEFHDIMHWFLAYKNYQTLLEERKHGTDYEWKWVSNNEDLMVPRKIREREGDGSFWFRKQLRWIDDTKMGRVITRAAHHGGRMAAKAGVFAITSIRNLIQFLSNNMITKLVSVIICVLLHLIAWYFIASISKQDFTEIFKKILLRSMSELLGATLIDQLKSIFLYFGPSFIFQTQWETHLKWLESFVELISSTTNSLFGYKDSFLSVCALGIIGMFVEGLRTLINKFRKDPTDAVIYILSSAPRIAMLFGGLGATTGFLTGIVGILATKRAKDWFDTIKNLLIDKLGSFLEYGREALVDRAMAGTFVSDIAHNILPYLFCPFVKGKGKHVCYKLMYALQKMLGKYMFMYKLVGWASDLYFMLDMYMRGDKSRAILATRCGSAIDSENTYKEQFEISTKLKGEQMKTDAKIKSLTDKRDKLKNIKTIVDIGSEEEQREKAKEILEIINKELKNNVLDIAGIDPENVEFEDFKKEFEEAAGGPRGVEATVKINGEYRTFKGDEFDSIFKSLKSIDQNRPDPNGKMLHDVEKFYTNAVKWLIGSKERYTDSHEEYQLENQIKKITDRYEKQINTQTSNLEVLDLAVQGMDNLQRAFTDGTTDSEKMKAIANLPNSIKNAYINLDAVEQLSKSQGFMPLKMSDWDKVFKRYSGAGENANEHKKNIEMYEDMFWSLAKGEYNVEDLKIVESGVDDIKEYYGIEDKPKQKNKIHRKPKEKQYENYGTDKEKAIYVANMLNHSYKYKGKSIELNGVTYKVTNDGHFVELNNGKTIYYETFGKTSINNTLNKKYGVTKEDTNGNTLEDPIEQIDNTGKQVALVSESAQQRFQSAKEDKEDEHNAKIQYREHERNVKQRHQEHMKRKSERRKERERKHRMKQQKRALELQKKIDEEVKLDLEGEKERERIRRRNEKETTRIKPTWEHAVDLDKHDKEYDSKYGEYEAQYANDMYHNPHKYEGEDVDIDETNFKIKNGKVYVDNKAVEEPWLPWTYKNDYKMLKEKYGLGAEEARQREGQTAMTHPYEYEVPYEFKKDTSSISDKPISSNEYPVVPYVDMRHIEARNRELKKEEAAKRNRDIDILNTMHPPYMG